MSIRAREIVRNFARFWRSPSGTPSEASSARASSAGGAANVYLGAAWTAGRTSLRAYLERNPKSAFELGKEVFGKRGSGTSILSARRHDYYVGLANAKRRRRR